MKDAIVDFNEQKNQLKEEISHLNGQIEENKKVMKKRKEEIEALTYQLKESKDENH
jgi:uncharacterized coiled-coil protein SlyX